MKLKSIIIALALVGAASLSSCGIGLIVRGVAKSKIKVENGVVPPEFTTSDQVLIVLMWGDKSYDKYAKKAFNKFYKGKKAFVGFDALLNDEKYSDTDTYRYVFSQGPGDLAMYGGGSYSYTSTGSRPFHIFDRKEKKFYKAKVTSGFFGRIMQAYAKKLNTFIH